ncbi:hypothetical protein Syun_000227 [Stephania yunnanensis]|uniref:Macro domain-containing protein n=1 Tax=Stephania yunnanensis TaxID=152371 RepID=A0AAP0LBJ1_9MAGN
MDSEMASKEEVEEDETKTRMVVVILVGAPGSGKSTFCEAVMKSAHRPWFRVCQDTIANGKAGTKAQCLRSAVDALKDGKSVFIDRCNLECEQRAEFVKLRRDQVDVHAVVLDLPARLCISRCVKRTGHEGNLQGGKAAAVVNRMLQKKELPKLSEGFTRITFCNEESDVESAVEMYSALGPLDALSSGCFGQKNSSSKVQVGIMKFLKKVEPSKIVDSNLSSSQGAVLKPDTEDSSCLEQKKKASIASVCDKEVEHRNRNLPHNLSGVSTVSVSDIPTLAFPSISTADFQFDIEKASDIIVEKVEEFLSKVTNARLVLVDLSHRSMILSMVKARAALKHIDSDRFFTFVGDITQLYTGGGLHCTAIANAANWRLKPGGGGVNAAIFNAAGPSLETATKERAGSLSPGSALVVPLPSSSPLHKNQGVTHVIHVLGPNMNPQRPNFLNNDYKKGCEVLHETYSSLFNGFLSVLKSSVLEDKINGQRQVSGASESDIGSPTDSFQNNDQKIKRAVTCELEKSKKYKGPEEGLGNRQLKVDCTEDMDLSCSSEAPQAKAPVKTDKCNGDAARTWSSWSLSLYHIAMHPGNEKYKKEIIELSDDAVVLNDLYPKAQKHLLVVARKVGLDCLADVREEHLNLLKAMHAMGEKWAKKSISEDTSLIFRLGYHSDPSMRQLHLHVISQDFNSSYLKNKKHWNTFNTAFFRDSGDVINEISRHGKATLSVDEKLLSMELRCHRCRSVHPNLPRLKSHISKCQAPFPATLLQNGHLISSPGEANSNEA